MIMVINVENVTKVAKEEGIILDKSGMENLNDVLIDMIRYIADKKKKEEGIS